MAYGDQSSQCTHKMSDHCSKCKTTMEQLDRAAKVGTLLAQGGDGNKAEAAAILQVHFSKPQNWAHHEAEFANPNATTNETAYRFQVTPDKPAEPYCAANLLPPWMSKSKDNNAIAKITSGCRRPHGTGEGFCNAGTQLAGTQRACKRSLNCHCGIAKDTDGNPVIAVATLLERRLHVSYNQATQEEKAQLAAWWGAKCTCPLGDLVLPGTTARDEAANVNQSNSSRSYQTQADRIELKPIVSSSNRSFRTQTYGTDRAEVVRLRACALRSR